MTYYFNPIKIVRLLNNIKKIQTFLDDRVNTAMILPKVSEEVTIFYQLLIEAISKQNSFLCKRIENIKNTEELVAPSLFAEQNTYIVDIGSTKNILENFSDIKDKSQKFFIFINYSSYKKNSFQSIQLNAYDYKKDISSFVQKSQDFQPLSNKISADFLNFSFDNPHLFFSELQKSEVLIPPIGKVKGYEADTILSVRRELFKYKNEFSIKILSKFYGLLKREVRIKKFNF